MQVTLKQARKLRGLTQVQLAKKLGISEPTMVSYEQDFSKMKISTANLAAEILGFTFDGIAFVVEENEQ